MELKSDSNLREWANARGIDLGEIPSQSIAYGWMVTNNHLYAERVLGHESAEMKRNVKTTEIRLIDRENSLCLTQDHLYHLQGEIK